MPLGPADNRIHLPDGSAAAITMMSSPSDQLNEQSIPHTNLCGFDLLAGSRQEVLDFLLARLTSGQGGWVLTLNLEILSMARLDPEYRALVQSADITLADGMPLVWASRYKRSVPVIPDRVTGSDLSADLIRQHPRSKVAIIGGANPPKALEKICKEDAHEVYVYSDRVTADEECVDRLIREVESHGANLVFLALGVPKQDYVAKRMRARMPHAMFLGVGGTFELIAGLKPRAPIWMRSSGLEWFWRLYVEPRRLWRRYLLLYWIGVGHLVDDTLRGRWGAK